MRPAAFAGVLIAPAVVAGTLLLLLASRQQGPPTEVTVDVFLFAVCLVVFFTAWGYGIFGAHAGDATFRELRLLRADHMRKDLARKQRDTQLALELTRTLSSALDFREILFTVVRRIAEVVHIDRVSVVLTPDDEPGVGRLREAGVEVVAA